jgi:GxxExxY protein
MEHEYKHKEITEKVIKAFYAVYNALGYGFLEKVYVQALVIELQNLGLEVARNVAITVFYAG